MTASEGSMTAQIWFATSNWVPKGKSLIHALIYTYIYIYIYIRIFRSSYRKLAWVVFECTTTGFRSDTLTDWPIRPCVQLTLRANFGQPLQFHFFIQCSRFILVFAFVSHQICFKQSLAQVIALVAKWIERS